MGISYWGEIIHFAFTLVVRQLERVCSLLRSLALVCIQFSIIHTFNKIPYYNRFISALSYMEMSSLT